MANPKNPLLPTEGDFTTILSALDCYVREATTMAYVREASQATVDITKDTDPEAELTNKELEKKILAKMDKTKVQDAINKVRDQIILLKAKVVHMKDIVNGAQLRDDINDLLEGT